MTVIAIINTSSTNTNDSQVRLYVTLDRGIAPRPQQLIQSLSVLHFGLLGLPCEQELLHFAGQAKISTPPLHVLDILLQLLRCCARQSKMAHVRPGTVRSGGGGDLGLQ